MGRCIWRGPALILFALCLCDGTHAATTITLPDILAVELPNPGDTSISATQSPMSDVLTAATATGGLTVTNDRTEANFNFPLGGTLVTWTAWNGLPHSSTVAATLSTYVFVFEHGQTPIGVSGDDYATAGNHGTSIARDPAGNIHVAWLDTGANPDGSARPIAIWYRHGTQDSSGKVTWTAPVDATSGTAVWYSYVKIAVTANAVHFAWLGLNASSQENTGTGIVRYRRLVNNGTAWNFDAIQTLTGVTGANHDNGPDIAAYNDNEVHIVTRNLIHAYNLTAANPATWVNETIPSPVGMLSDKYPTITLDSKGDVHIAYTALMRTPGDAAGDFNNYWKVWYLHRQSPRIGNTWLESFDSLSQFTEWQDPGAGSSTVRTDVAGDWINIACDEQDTIHLGWHGTAISHFAGKDDAFYTRRASGSALFEQPKRLHTHETDTVNGLQYSWTPSFCCAPNGITIPVIMYKARGMVDPSNFSNSFQDYDDMDAIARVLQNGSFIDGGSFVPVSNVAINNENIAGCWPNAAPRTFRQANGKAWLDVLEGLDCSKVFQPSAVDLVLNNGTPNRTYIVHQRVDVTGFMPPMVVTPPANATVFTGQKATFSVTASGAATLTYQWLLNGNPITGANGSSYTTPATVLGDSGSIFSVKVTNSLGNVTSASATLTVKTNLGPTMNSNPTATPNPANVGDTVSFGAAATDTDGDPLTYSWNFGDGSALGSGATPTHVYATVGTFTVTVTVSDLVNLTASGTVSVTINAGSGSGGGGSGSGSGGGGGGGGSGGTGSGGTGANGIIMSVSKALGSAHFNTTNKDAVSLSGTIPNLASPFNPAGQTLSLNVGGAIATFTLDGKGKGKTAQGSIALKLKKSKGSKGSKSTFLGGNIPFKAALKGGTWAATWGMNPAVSAKNQPMTMTIALTLNGVLYDAVVTVKYSAKATVGGKFKK